jgi:nickel transport protein
MEIHMKKIVCKFNLNALISAASAHDLVLIPEPSGDLTVRFGHPGDWQPASVDRLLGLQMDGAAVAGRKGAATLRTQGKNLVASKVASQSQAHLVNASYDNGLWVTVPDAAGKPVYFNTSKAMLPQATTSMAALKFAKGLYATSGDTAVFKREVNHLIELIPQRNPADVKPGQSLSVLVKFNGVPLANAGVELTDSATKTTKGQAKFTTDAQGMASVPIRRGGLNVISVDHEQPNNGTLGAPLSALPVDQIAVIATYAFQVR